MSFETLKVSELKEIADDFGVDVEGLKGKANIIAAMADEGVTWALYSKSNKDKAEAAEEIEILPKFDPKKKIEQDEVLVRMTRQNVRYDIQGFTFTREHPFVAMSNKKAQAIFDKEDGFRIATPKEVQDFYS